MSEININNMLCNLAYPKHKQPTCNILYEFHKFSKSNVCFKFDVSWFQQIIFRVFKVTYKWPLFYTTNVCYSQVVVKIDTPSSRATTCS